MLQIAISTNGLQSLRLKCSFECIAFWRFGNLYSMLCEKKCARCRFVCVWLERTQWKNGIEYECFCFFVGRNFRHYWTLELGTFRFAPTMLDNIRVWLSPRCFFLWWHALGWPKIFKRLFSLICRRKKWDTIVSWYLILGPLFIIYCQW